MEDSDEADPLCVMWTVALPDGTANRQPCRNGNSARWYLTEKGVFIILTGLSRRQLCDLKSGLSLKSNHESLLSR